MVIGHPSLVMHCPTTIHVHLNYDNGKSFLCDFSHHSLIVPGSNMELREKYKSLLPPPPRIIDPVNPSNNLYISGIRRSKKGENGWCDFGRKVDELDLHVQA